MGVTIAETYRRSAAVAVFVALLAIYLINPDPFWSGDLNSNSVFAFNLLAFKTIYLDAFATSDLFKGFFVQGYSYSFIVLPAGHIGAGHWTLAYPPGAAIITFPIYFVFYVWFWLIGAPVGITTPAFEPYRLAFSHISAAVLSAATVTLFFMIVRRRFSTRTALIVTACLGLATNQWGLLTQSMLQHGPSSFAAIASAYLLLRADGAKRWSATGLLFVAGAFAGLLFMIRPTSLVFAAALLTFAALYFRSRSASFAVGFAVTFGATLAWNWFFFHSLAGPAIFQGHAFNLSVETFIAAFSGMLFSPSRGMIPNSPFLLFIVVGVGVGVATIIQAVRRWDFHKRCPDTLLFTMLLGASTVLFLSYCFSPFWTGAAYGIRYLSETMPFIVYFLAFSPTVQGHGPVWRRVLFVVFVAVGIAHQIVAIVGGAAGHAFWGNLPYGDLDLQVDRRWDYLRDAPLRSFQTRSWDFSDTLAIRILRGVYSNRYEMSPSIAGATNYATRCKATIVAIAGADGRGFDQFRLQFVGDTISVADRVWNSFSAGRKFVRARIRNDGEVPIHSYRSGLHWGFGAMTHKVIGEDGRAVYEGGTVYVTGMIRPGETGDAVGSMSLPLTKGRYRVDVRMAVNGIGYCGESSPMGTFIVE